MSRTVYSDAYYVFHFHILLSQCYCDDSWDVLDTISFPSYRSDIAIPISLVVDCFG
jgi:hypothetical protein